MTRFIAIRKPKRGKGAPNGSRCERRSLALTTGLPAESSDALHALGLRPVAPEEHAPGVRNAFQELNTIGAYVVDAASNAIGEAARAELGDDYHIMPDIPLALPAPLLSTGRLRRPRGGPEWPEASGVAAAHAAGVTGKGVLIGVLDSGCDADHLELRRKRVDFRYVPAAPRPDAMRACFAFDTVGHGTHVCGILAGQNVGIAPDAELLVASVLESESLKTSLDRIVIALNWMLAQFETEANLNKPAIVNMSLGFLPEWISGADLQSAMEGIRLLISTLVDDFDVLPVVAVGNDGPGKIRMPGSLPQTLAVGAVDFRLQPASFSGGGVSPVTQSTEPDVAGYGVNVLSSLERDVNRRSWYARMSGTSMSTPYVTGIAALAASADPELQGQRLRQHLLDTALKIEAPADRVGAGLARWLP